MWSVEEIIKGVVGAVVAGIVGTIGAVVGWLVKHVLDTDKEILMLKAKVENLEKDKVTVECVREVVEEAFANREKIEEERAKRTTLEFKAIVIEQMELLTPKIVKEVRMATGVFPKVGEGKSAS